MIADIFKIKAAVSFPKPSYNYSCINLILQSNISRIYGYNQRNLLLLTAFHAYLRYLFVTRYNCVLLVCLHELYYKGLLFVGTTLVVWE